MMAVGVSPVYGGEATEKGGIMARPKRKKMRAVWLGQALKEIRESAKLNTKHVGDYIRKDASMVSRMENGEVSVSKDTLVAFIEVCGLADNHRISDLGIIQQDATQGGWWDGYRKDVASTLMDRAWMEMKALSIQSFEIASLPGLLQLPEYSAAVMRTGLPATSEPEVQRWTEMRMQRQHIITKHRPVQFHSVIDEHLLRRVAGDAQIMKEQLDYLSEVGERPNVTIRVLPSDTCWGIPGSFELFDLADPYPEVAYLATSAGDLCVEGDELDELAQTYDRLIEASLDPEASRDLIIAERDKL